MYRHGLNAEFFASAKDAQGNLATVCNQNLVEHLFLPGFRLLDYEQLLAIFNRLAVVHQDCGHRA